MSAIGVVTRKTARKAKGDGHLRRAEILEAAERIFVAEGYEGATIRKIADEVGVSSTALYMHFKDKSCILHEICERTMQQLLDRNTEIAGRSADEMAEHQLPDPGGRIRLRPAGPFGFDPLRAFDPLLERINACIRWKLWVLPGLVRRHDLPLCAAPALDGGAKDEEHGGVRGRQGAAPL